MAGDYFVKISSYFSISEPDSVSKYLLKSISIAEKLNNTDALIQRLFSLSNIYRESGRYKEAKQAINRILQLSRFNTDYESEAQGHNALGIVYRRELNFQEAEKNTLQAISILQDRNSEKYSYLAKYYSSLGRIYVEQEDFVSAVKALKKAREICESHSEKVERMDRGSALYFLGTTYMQMDSVDQAEEVMEAYVQFAKERTDYESFYKKGNHGPLAMFMRDTALATRHYRNAYLKERGRGNKKRLAIACSNLAQLAMASKHFDEAALLAKEAIDNAGQDLETVNMMLPLLASAHEKLENPDSARYYQNQYKLMHDTLTLREADQGIDSLIRKYEEMEKLRQEQDKNLVTLFKDAASNWMLALFAALGIFGLIFFVKKRKNKVIDKQNK